MKPFRAYPLSFRIFAIAALVVALQAFPATGIFLMLLMAPFWSILLVNLGFLAMARDALTGALSVAWLLGPLLWFGGYGLVAWRSHVEADALIAQADALNAGQHLPFDPTRHALVMREGAGQMAERYDIPVVYEPASHIPGATHVATRLASGAICNRVWGDRRYAAAHVEATMVRAGSEAVYSRILSGVCAITAPEKPALPQIVVTETKESGGGWLVHALVTTITLQAPDRPLLRLRSVSVVPWSWWPKPIAGCFLNSGAPKWDCEFSFGRGASRSMSTHEIVAQALGLQRAPISVRLAEIAAQPDPDLDLGLRLHEENLAAQRAADLASLDEALRGARDNGGDLRTAELVTQPALYADRAPAILDAMRRGFAARTFGRTQKYGDLLAALPDDAFKPLAPALLDLLNAQSELPRDALSSPLIRRLGALGVEALPTLRRLAASPAVGYRHDVIVALCKIGAPALDDAEKIADVLAATRRDKSVRGAAFRALLRLGRPDLLARDPKLQALYAKPPYNRWAATITPASAPAVCDHELH